MRLMVYATLWILPTFLSRPCFADERGADTSAYDTELLARTGTATHTAGLLKLIANSTPRDVDTNLITLLIGRLNSPDYGERESSQKRLLEFGAAALIQCRVAAARGQPEAVRRVRAVLAEVCSSRSPQRTSALIVACRTLARRGSDGAIEALLQLLPTAIDGELEEEIWFALDRLASTRDASNKAYSCKVGDPLPLRRAAAGYLCARYGTEAARERARPLLSDPNALVRLRVAQGYLGASDRTAIPALIGTLDSLPLTTQAWEAEELLRWLAGADSPTAVIGVGDKVGRTKCQAAWQAWWEKNGDKIDLTRSLAADLRPYLFVCTAPRSAYLVGSDGVIRWSIPGRGLRIDQFLDSDQVLVRTEGLQMDMAAESTPFRPVSEAKVCNLAGNVSWTHRIEYPPGKADAVHLAWRRVDGSTVVTNGWRVNVIPPYGGTGRDYTIIDSQAARPSCRICLIEDRRGGNLLGMIRSNGHWYEQSVEFDPDTGKVVSRNNFDCAGPLLAIRFLADGGIYQELGSEAHLQYRERGSLGDPMPSVRHIIADSPDVTLLTDLQVGQFEKFVTRTRGGTLFFFDQRSGRLLERAVTGRHLQEVQLSGRRATEINPGFSMVRLGLPRASVDQTP